MTANRCLTSEPVVSVIVPAYNTAAYIAEALDSVFNQSFESPFEVIVINDGSRDTAELERVLAPYRDRITYFVQDNRGSSAARNTGLRLARGRYVAMLDSDDRFHSEYLASQLAILESDPSIDVVYPDAERFGIGRPGERYSSRFPVGGTITFSRVLARDCQIYGEVTARAEVLRSIGGYDEDLACAEDYDLWLRILHAGGRIVYNDRVLAYYRVRDDSHTANARKLNESVIQVLNKAERLPDLTDADRTSIANQREWLISRLQLQQAREAVHAGDAAAALRLLRTDRGARPSRTLRVAMLAFRFVPTLAVKLYRFAEAHGAEDLLWR